MANKMLLDEDFRHSHQDLIGMEVSTLGNDHTDNSSNKDESFELLKEQKEADHNSNNSNNSNSPRKSVDFAVPPPPKRARPAPDWTLKQALQAVSVAISTEDRSKALLNTRDLFAHEIQSIHNEELDAGADAVLTKHLAFLLWPLFETKIPEISPANSNISINSDMENVTDELSVTLEALESIFKAGSDMVGRSYRRVGGELIKILMTALNRELDRRIEQKIVLVAGDGEDGEARDKTNTEGGGSASTNSGAGDEKKDENTLENNKNDEDEDDDGEKEKKGDDFEAKGDSKSDLTPELNAEPETASRATKPKQIYVAAHVPSVEGDNVIKKTTRILGHFARVGDITKPLAHFPGLLGTLVRLVTLYPYDRIPWEARLSAIWTLANLGCNSENMQMMVCTPGLVDALVLISCRSLHPGDSVETTVEVLRGRSIASRCILNLSWCPENKIVLGGQAALIDLLCELAVHRHAPLAKSHTVRDILVTTRRHALGALRNLAAAPRRSKIALAEYKNGHLLSVLTDAALNDPDQDVVDRAFAAIHNLAIHDIADQMVNHPALVLALKDVLMSSQEDELAGKDTSHEAGTPRSHAAATLMVLERSIQPDMASYQNLRDLLDALNPSPPTDEEEEDEDQPDQITEV